MTSSLIRQQLCPGTAGYPLTRSIATLTLDATGPSLPKRGYRSDAGEAPLKETQAAALVLLSRWVPTRVLADPCCGSATIAIQAP